MASYLIHSMVVVLILGGGLFGCARPTQADDPPIELVFQNIENTDETVVLRVISVEEKGVAGVYTTWLVSGDVEETIKGNLSPGSRVNYRRTLEGSGPPARVGARYLASFERNGDELRLPDVAYHFEFTSSLEKEVKRYRPSK